MSSSGGFLLQAENTPGSEKREAHPPLPSPPPTTAAPFLSLPVALSLAPAGTRTSVRFLQRGQLCPAKKARTCCSLCLGRHPYTHTHTPPNRLAGSPPLTPEFFWDLSGASNLKEPPCLSAPHVFRAPPYLRSLVRREVPTGRAPGSCVMATVSV